MVLGTGQISFSEIQTEFGGTNPVSFSEYYTNANPSYTNGISGLPTIGNAINIGNFKGKAKVSGGNGLYNFNSHTFTNAGASGRYGPTLAQLQESYSYATWTQNTNYLNMTTQGIQQWTVPATGSYNITAAGAKGGGNSGFGRGALIKGDFNLTQGTKLYILVGQVGGQETYDVGGGIYSGGGGGGTFISLNSLSGTLVLVAGGGGGRSRTSALDASYNETDTFTGSSQNAGVNNEAYGGAGYSGETSASIGHTPGNIAKSFLNGGVGGLGSSDGGQGFGGFGGGGGEGYADGGGGGGYSGGNAGNETGQAGGGGSYFNLTIGSNRNNVGSNSGHGYVTIAANFNISTQSILPAYYTSSSGYMMYYTYNETTANLKLLSNLNSSTTVRTYTGITACWNIVHDKDLDSNIYYGMPEFSRILYRYTFTKGGTSISSATITTYTGATTSVLGACYAPSCMGTSNGAFIIGGYNQSVIHVLEFDSQKNISYTYTVPYTNEVYGTEVIPKQASGFTQDFAVAYTRNTKLLSSFTVNMSTRTWGNLNSTTYTSGTTGPSNGLGMLYYPPNKAIFTGDLDISTNRIAMNDTATSKLFVYTITQNNNSLTFTWLKNVDMIGPSLGGYPYSLSTSAYNSLS